MPISLPAELIETFQLNGVLEETHDSVAAVLMQIDFVNHSVLIEFFGGSPANNSFVPGPRSIYSPWAMIDTNTGDWNSSNGAGTLSAPQLATLKGNLTNARNGAEGLAAATGVIPGTPVAWT